MGEQKLCVHINYGWGDKHTQRGTHINTTTRPGLKPGLSEKGIWEATLR